MFLNLGRALYESCMIIRFLNIEILQFKQQPRFKIIPLVTLGQQSKVKLFKVVLSYQYECCMNHLIQK